jgi:hypothetical protein
MKKKISTISGLSNDSLNQSDISEKSLSDISTPVDYIYIMILRKYNMNYQLKMIQNFKKYLKNGQGIYI